MVASKAWSTATDIPADLRAVGEVGISSDELLDAPEGVDVDNHALEGQRLEWRNQVAIALDPQLVLGLRPREDIGEWRA